jgi:hypothetical protein
MTPVWRVTSDRLAIGLLFVAMAALACFSPTQSDTWWLLRAGEDTWRTGVIPLEDTYSHTAAGEYWPNHEWLTEVVFYLLHRIGGMPLLTAACAALILATWTVSWRLMRGGFELRFALFGASLVTATTAWAVRPQAFSMAAFAATIALLAAGRIAWLPLVCLVWANLHGAVALGLAAIAGAGVAELVRERRVPWRLVAAGALSGLATLATPLGTGLWSFIPASMERSRINQLIEWQAPDAGAMFWPFWMLAAALPVVVLWRWRRLDLPSARLAGVALAMLPLAVQAMRNVPIFLLVAVPALAGALARPSASASVRPGARGERVGVNAVLLGAAAVGAAAVVALAWAAPAPRLGWRPISPRAMDAIAKCEDPVYNTYGQGGILIWFVRDRRVFIDNRQDPYPLDLLRANRQAELTGNYDSLFQAYGIRCAALPATSVLTDRLHDDRAWGLRYSDAQWTVFGRDPAGLAMQPTPSSP